MKTTKTLVRTNNAIAQTVTTGSRPPSRVASTPRVTALTDQVNANSRLSWNSAVNADRTMNALAPMSPRAGCVSTTQAIAMQTLPTTTHSCDCSRVGQLGRSQIAAIATQQMDTPTASQRSVLCDGPMGLKVRISGMVLNPSMLAAVSRQVDLCSPRAARYEVSQ